MGKVPSWKDIINELTARDLKTATDPKSQARSKLLPFGSTFQSVDGNGVITFTTHSQFYHQNGLIYTQHIEMIDFKESVTLSDLTLKERVNLAIFGDLKCDCSCPAFLFWGYKYILTELEAVYGPGEGRYPVVRNPGLNGSVCKHLHNVLVALPFQINKVAGDLQALGIK